MTFIHLITSFIYVDTQWYYSAQAKVCQAEKILYEPLCLLFIAGARNDVPPNVCKRMAVAGRQQNLQREGDARHKISHLVSVGAGGDAPVFEPGHKQAIAAFLEQGEGPYDAPAALLDELRAVLEPPAKKQPFWRLFRR
jgi:hypothetical protein